MLNNPYFFIILSFVLFLYVGYKKIWPDIIKGLKDDIKKIKKEFGILETKKSTLKKELKILLSNHDSFKSELQQIHTTSLEHAENIKNVYMKNMDDLSQNHLSSIDKIYLRMVQRFENESLKFFSKELTLDLIKFFEKQKSNKNFQKDILQKSLILLQK